MRELRYAIRSLGKSPLYSLLAILALALGIGANSSVFSVFYSVILKPLDFPHSDRIVVALHAGQSPVSPADFLDWRKDTRSYDRVAAAQAWGATLTGDGHPEILHGMQVTGDLFPLLGVNPLLGRAIAPADETNHILVLSHALWQRRFASDPSVIGRRVTVNNEPYVITAVMPPSFRFAPFWVKDAELWAPLNLTPRLNDRDGRSLRVFGRLRDGVTIAAAQAELGVIAKRLAAAYPATNTDVPAPLVLPLQEKAIGNVRPTVIVLLGTVAFVMLMACANVANLLLARQSARERETAVHLALGAAPRRLIWRSLLESTLLASIGGAAGLLLAKASLALLIHSLPEGSLPRQSEVALDATAVLFTLSLSLLTGILCGLAPARFVRRTALATALHGGSRGATTGTSQKRTRQFLVTAEVALAVILLAGAGLMIRSFSRLRAVDPGFNPRHLVTFTVAPGGRDPRLDFYARLQRDLESIPGVQSASLINHLPINGDMWTLGLRIAGRPQPAPGHEEGAVYRVIRPRYFATMSIPLRQGRDFTDLDKAPVAIVNQSLARRHWPADDPIGKQIAIAGESQWRTIVGVTADVKQEEWTARPMDEVYVPQDQAPLPASEMTVVARTSSTAALTDRVRALDPNVPTSRPQPMEQIISEQLWQNRLSTSLLATFAAIALILAAVGLYGVLSYSVTRQLREFGIRMALGATPANVLTTVLTQAMSTVLAGLLIGVAGSLALSRLIAALLYETSITDPITFTAVPALLVTVALAACYLPARRATSIDPAISLRSE
ncbi:MAG: ABC transporter permease [Bryobacteraceae bacterium]